MKSAIIGRTGFVGTTLSSQFNFDLGYRSSDIDEIKGRAFDLIVCAGAPAAKWIANGDPEGDMANIGRLIGAIAEAQAETFVLISTVDVFREATSASELVEPNQVGLHAYGNNRRVLEQFVQSHFKRSHVIRLPGLVGPGLRKNAIYDLVNGNETSKVDSRGVFQFYPTERLMADVQRTMELGLSLVHLVPPPVSVGEVAKAMGIDFRNELPRVPAHYDLSTIHGAAFGGCSRYSMSKEESLSAAARYAQSVKGSGK